MGVGSRGGERGGRAGEDVSLGCLVFFEFYWEVVLLKMSKKNHETKLK